jgi:hypothetical protein
MHEAVNANERTCHKPPIGVEAVRCTLPRIQLRPRSLEEQVSSADHPLKVCYR